MAWLAVESSGTEKIFVEKPHRGGEDNGYRLQKWEQQLLLRAEAKGFWYPMALYVYEGVISYTYSVILPKGSIKKLIGRNLTWEDSPVEIK